MTFHREVRTIGEKGRSNSVRETRAARGATPSTRERRTVRLVGVLALVPPALHTAHENIDSRDSTVHTRVTWLASLLGLSR